MCFDCRHGVPKKVLQALVQTGLRVAGPIEYDYHYSIIIIIIIIIVVIIISIIIIMIIMT